MQKTFRQVDITGKSWPSGDCLPIATLALEPDALSQRLGLVFKDDEEDGLGPVKYAGLELSSGEQFLLTWHKYSPDKKFATVLYADAKVDKAAMLKLFLEGTDIKADEVTWEPKEEDPEEYESGPDGTTEKDPFGG